MGWRQVEEEAQGAKMLSTMLMETESGVVSDNNDTSAHHSNDSRLFKREVSIAILLLTSCGVHRIESLWLFFD